MSNEKQCPICGCNKIIYEFPHKEYIETTVYVCNECYCGYNSIGRNIVRSFKTKIRRATAHANHIINKFPDVRSICEIGSGRSFWFLKTIHEHDANIKLYLHDNFDYSKLVPDYINFYPDFNNLDEKVDLLFMSHSIEHLSDINSFLTKACKIFKYGYMEFPNITKDRYINLVANKEPTDYHNYFFSETNFELLMKKYNINILSIEHLRKGAIKFIVRFN